MPSPKLKKRLKEEHQKVFPKKESRNQAENTDHKEAFPKEESRNQAENTDHKETFPKEEPRNPVSENTIEEITEFTRHDETFSKSSESNVVYKKQQSIPFIIHVIHITKKHDIKEIDSKDLSILKSNMQLLNQWQLFIWTNNYKYLSESKSYCNTQIQNCVFKDISDLSNYKLTQYRVNTLVNSDLVPLAEYILSMNILKDYGGLYTTMSFVFRKSPAILHDYLDFYTGIKNAKKIDPNFIAAKPQHPVIVYHEHMINGFYGIEKNISLPYFPKEIISYNSALELIGGPVSLSSAFYLYANDQSNVYIVLNQNMIAGDADASQQISFDNSQSTLQKIGSYTPVEVQNSGKIYLNIKDPVILSPLNKEDCGQDPIDYGSILAVNKILKSSNKLICNNDSSIEYISHRAWLTDPDSPYLLKKEVLKIAQHSIKMLDTDKNKWTHYWWMLKKEHYTDEMKQMFNENNIELHTVDELYPFYPKLELAIKNAAKVSGSLTVDILKCLVIYHYGGFYVDVDFLVQSIKSFNTLHQCSEAYFPHNARAIGNAMMASKKNNVLLEVITHQFIELLANEPNKFSGCPKPARVMRFNDYGLIKPFVDLILSEKVEAHSVILGHIALFSNKMSDKCLTETYGNITLSTIGYDLQFNTWNSLTTNDNIAGINSFVADNFALIDFCSHN